MENRTYYVILNKEGMYLSTETDWIPEGEKITAYYSPYIDYADEFENLTELYNFINDFDNSKELYKGLYEIAIGEIELGSIEKVTTTFTKEKVLQF